MREKEEVERKIEGGERRWKEKLREEEEVERKLSEGEGVERKIERGGGKKI